MISISRPHGTDASVDAALSDDEGRDIAKYRSCEMLRILSRLSSAEFVVSEKPTLAGVDIDRFQQ